jgi:hypothetical protein
MGADKNSSLWLNSAYTPIATLRTHKHKHDPKQGSNNLKGTTKKPRNKSQTSPMRKHNSKSKGLTQSGKHQADRLQCPGGLFARRARTVREEGTNRPKLLPEPPVLHREKRTVRDGPADHPVGSRIPTRGG